MTMRSTWRCHPATCRTAKRFLGEERGSITVFVIMGFVLCLGIVGLAFDVGRVMGIHTEVAAFADRAALAAAEQLDGRPNAVVSAVDRARGIGNGKRMTLTDTGTSNGNTNGAITIARIEFRETMNGAVITSWTPQGGNGNGTYGGAAPNSAAAQSVRYATVITSGAQEGFLLFPFTGSSTNSISVSPTAMASFEREACNIAPIMVCNPSEGGALGPGAPYAPMDMRTDENFRLQGPYAPGRFQDWGPGTYSLMTRVGDPRPAVSALRDLIGEDHPGTACYGRRIMAVSNLNNANDIGGNGGGNGNGGNVDNNSRIEIGRGFNDRIDRGLEEFPVAIVNCLEHYGELINGQDVPVETYGEMTIRHDIDDDDSDERGQIEVRRTGVPQRDIGHVQEYSVLVR